MSAPKLLDLFCCAGGAGMGYHRAGFDVTGVDIAPQPHYPFVFIQADALEYVTAHGHEYDVIHASPPCQAYSLITKNELRGNHPRLISAVRDLLIASGKPYIIENVSGAARSLNAPIILCGAYFGLKVYRHRYFEVNPFILAPSHFPHRDNTPRAGHGLSSKGFISVTQGGQGMGLGGNDYARAAMGVEWMSGEFFEAIPPAYTEYIGRELMYLLFETTQESTDVS